jgi:sterol desaturase/sphingolipid hydroxylase (fatty acid hydroxylase superfamily)
VRKHGGADPGYHRSLLGWHPQTKEVVGLAAAAALYAPLFPVAPFFTATMWWSMWNYHRVHKKAHLDPEWARQHVPWHYDHHMGPNQHKNWCVTKPWFDILMGTRVPYAGTPREAADRARRGERATSSPPASSPPASSRAA